MSFFEEKRSCCLFKMLGWFINKEMFLEFGFELEVLFGLLDRGLWWIRGLGSCLERDNII